MMPFRWQASWAKMTSPWGKLTALVCHLTKKVNNSDSAWDKQGGQAGSGRQVGSVDVPALIANIFTPAAQCL